MGEGEGEGFRQALSHHGLTRTVVELGARRGASSTAAPEMEVAALLEAPSSAPMKETTEEETGEPSAAGTMKGRPPGEMAATAQLAAGHSILCSRR